MAIHLKLAPLADAAGQPGGTRCACGVRLRESAGSTHDERVSSLGHAHADAEPNRRYCALPRRLKADRDGTRELTEALRAGIVFHNSVCVFRTTGMTGGSAEPFACAVCLEETTKSWPVALQRYLDCREGDMSCPVAAQ